MVDLGGARAGRRGAVNAAVLLLRLFRPLTPAWPARWWAQVSDRVSEEQALAAGDRAGDAERRQPGW